MSSYGGFDCSIIPGISDKRITSTYMSERRILMTGRITQTFVFIVALLALVLFASSQVLAQKAPVAGGASQYASLDGARIHYQNYGKGAEALVLIHGWTCNLDNWRDQIPDFAKRNRVIALDLPGHGLSDKPKITYTMDLFATAVDAVMRDAKVERAVLVGHSMGTPVARQFYRKYPQKTLAIVIVDGGLRLFGTEEMRKNFLATFRAPYYQDAALPMFDGMIGPHMAAEGRERIRKSFLNTPHYVLLSAMEEMNDASLYRPDQIKVPVLAIMAKSPFWADDTEEFFRSIAPKLDFQMWEGVAHFLMMEKPKEFNAAVIAFLDKNSLLK
jgi:non-heme chloroperoxidase